LRSLPYGLFCPLSVPIFRFDTTGLDQTDPAVELWGRFHRSKLPARTTNSKRQTVRILFGYFQSRKQFDLGVVRLFAHEFAIALQGEEIANVMKVEYRNSTDALS
jgi:hypothetical protein